MSPLSLPMRISHRLRQREREFVAFAAKAERLIERARSAVREYPEKARELRQIERRVRRLNRRNKADLVMVRALRILAERIER